MYAFVTFGGTTYSSTTTSRAWAHQATTIANAVQEVYQRRSDIVRGFFQRPGFQGPDAEIRTRLTLCYPSWERSIYEDDSEANQLKMLTLQHELLTKK